MSDTPAEQPSYDLYKIDDDCTLEQHEAIGQLRQLINEVFVAQKRQISSQVIYDMLKEVL